MKADSSATLRKSPGCKLPNGTPSQLPIVGGISFHHLVIFIGTVCAALAILITLGQILSHAAQCYRVTEQKYIMRVLLIIPGFGIFYTIGSWFYPSFEYLSLIPEIIEAFSFVSLFQLFVFMATGTTDRHNQESFFLGLDRCKRKKAYQLLVPSQRKKPSELRHKQGSLRWFRVIWLCVFQFPAVKFTWTIINIILTYFICPTSSAGKGIKVLNGLTNSISTSAALWAMILFYARLREMLKPRHAFRKAFVFKKMIGILLSQSVVMSFVAGAGAIHPTPQMSYGDFTIGIPAFMGQCEMFIYSLLFLWCYNVSEFVQLHKSGPGEASLLVQNTELAGGRQVQEVSFFRALWAMINISDFLHGLVIAVRSIPAITRKERTLDGVPAHKWSPQTEPESDPPLPYALKTATPPTLPPPLNSHMVQESYPMQPYQAHHAY